MHWMSGEAMKTSHPEVGPERLPQLFVLVNIPSLSAQGGSACTGQGWEAVFRVGVLRC